MLGSLAMWTGKGIKACALAFQWARKLRFVSFDSGKTTLAQCISTTASTAAFDKNPQSKERGITLDLGFRSGH